MRACPFEHVFRICLFPYQLAKTLHHSSHSSQFHTIWFSLFLRDAKTWNNGPSLERTFFRSVLSIANFVLSSFLFTGKHIHGRCTLKELVPYHYCMQSDPRRLKKSTADKTLAPHAHFIFLAMKTFIYLLCSSILPSLWRVQAFSPALSGHDRHRNVATASSLTCRPVPSSQQVEALHQQETTAQTRTYQKDSFTLANSSRRGDFPFQNPFQAHEATTSSLSTSTTTSQQRAQTAQAEGNVATVRLIRGLADAMYSPAQAVVEKRLCHFLEETVELAAERQACNLAWRRLGTTVMAVLPLFGAAFALYLAHHDLHRAQHELEQQQHQAVQSRIPILPASGVPTFGLENLSLPTVLAAGLFLMAGLADVVDAMLHVIMSHHIFTVHNVMGAWQHALHPVILPHSVEAAPTHLFPMGPAGTLLHHLDPRTMLHLHADATTAWHPVELSPSSTPPMATAPHDGATTVATATTSNGSETLSLAVLEEWSSMCALASAMCVAAGEVTSFWAGLAATHQDDMPRHDESDSSSSSSFSSSMPPLRKLPQAA